MRYRLPTAPALPPLEVTHIETLPPVTLGGFKGMAEGGTIGATSTIANAVADALGTTAPRSPSSRSRPNASRVSSRPPRAVKHRDKSKHAGWHPRHRRGTGLYVSFVY